MKKGLIREILSPCVVSTIHVPKEDGDWRMCIDSRTINRVTIKYIFPLTMMDDIMDYLSGEKYFIKIDLKSSYYQIKTRGYE